MEGLGGFSRRAEVGIIAGMATYTVRDAAEQLEISDRRVRALCQKHEIGTLITPRQRLLTAGDIATLRRVRQEVGNPNFGPGFHEARARKRRAKRKRRRRPS